MTIASTAVAEHDATETIVGARSTSTLVPDQNIVNSETRLFGELGLTGWLAADVVLPIRIFHTTIRYLDPSGQAVAIENPDLHHRNETLTGPGDPWLLARAATRALTFTLGARAGLTI